MAFQCDGCAESPAEFMVSSTATGDTSALCTGCLFAMTVQLVEAATGATVRLDIPGGPESVQDAPEPPPAADPAATPPAAALEDNGGAAPPYVADAVADDADDSAPAPIERLEDAMAQRGTRVGKRRAVG